MTALYNQDPREYLPFLSELQKLRPNYQKFRIDDSLGKREKALTHLYGAGEDHWDECKTYVKSHKLYKAALKVFEQDPDKLQVSFSDSAARSPNRFD